MLKLIYSASTKEISLKVGKERPFFTKSLLKAFIIALSLHLCSGILIRIKTPKTSKDVRLKQSQVIADLNHYKTDLSFEEKSLLVFNQEAFNLDSDNFEKKHILALDTLNSSEIKRGASFLHNPAPPPKIDFYQDIEPFKISLRGALKPIKCEFKVKKQKVPINSTVTLSILFDVTLSSKTKKVLKAHISRSSGSEKYDQYAKNILNNVYFEIPKNAENLLGQIECFIEVERRSLK